MTATDDITDETNKEAMKAKKRQELKEQLEKSKRLAQKDDEKLKSM